MKRVIVLAIMGCLLFAIPAQACKKRPIIIKKTEKIETTIVDQDHNAWDYGAYLHAILFETENTEWGAFATWLNESNDTRVYFGGKIYLNRLTFQKK